MNQKKLNKTSMMISHWKKPFGVHDLYENNSDDFTLEKNPLESMIYMKII